MEVVIEGNCYRSGRLDRCCVGIDDGRIVKVGRDLEGDRTYRFGGKMILPAAIDAHVHFRDPGMTEKEDFGHGSLAALHGGVTCVFDMPNTSPPTVNLASINDKRRVAASTSLVDFGLFAGVRPGSDIAGMAKEVIGFKLYMAGTTGDLFVPQLDQVSKELAAVATTGKVLAVHAEDEKLRRREPEKGLEDHMKNRNGDCETSAIKKIREAAKGVRLHICHVSAKESIPLVTRAEGVTSEVTPHHLLLDKDSKTGTFGKVNPPLRKREDRQALFKALKDGVFDIVASDHAPHTIDEKQEDFDYAPAGMPGVETMLPLMLQLVRDKHLSISDLVTRACARPGEIYGVAKGRIEAGYDADLIVVDMTAESAIRAGNLNSKCGWTAYDGMKAIFPKAVFLRGQLMMEDGSQVGERIGRDVIDSAGKP